MRFRKKPVVVEAIRWGEDGRFVGRAPDWMDEACLSGIVHRKGPNLFIKTLEGEMAADMGDWIIRGVKGELYPCKPDIFAATYEEADRAEEPADLDALVERCQSWLDERRLPLITLGFDNTNPDSLAAFVLARRR